MRIEWEVETELMVLMQSELFPSESGWRAISYLCNVVDDDL